MSFLNPVSEPVKRFSSTDAGAPQINYNSRVAGDIKTVLKACLVTGYGSKASAGWSMVNEVDNVAEFVSPSVAMSDYRLGIDDSTATKTDWYYQYQDVRNILNYSSPTKSFDYIDKTHNGNGWQLLVTDRGIVFIEFAMSLVIHDHGVRLTYWGQTKLATNDSDLQNIAYFNIGHGVNMALYDFFSSSDYTRKTYRVGGYSTGSSSKRIGFSFAGESVMSKNASVFNASVQIDLISKIYCTTADNLILCEQPAIAACVASGHGHRYGVVDTVIAGRPSLYVLATYGLSSSKSDVDTYSRAVIINTDYWEY